MNDGDIKVVTGQTDIIPSSKRYDILNWYPSPYVEIYFLTPEEQEEEKRQMQAKKAPVKELMKPCARCKRPVKARYTYCYRCFNYIQVKARIAKEQAS